MNDRGEHKPCCYFHPMEAVVGICALCLKEKLLVLASEQGHLPLCRRYLRVPKRKPVITLPKVFVLGAFGHLLESHHHTNKDHSGREGPIASLEDSFISIKFEDEGQVLSKNKKDKSFEASTDTTTIGKETKEVKTTVEQSDHSGFPRWRKHIGRLLHQGIWKRSNEASTCHFGFGGKVEGVKRTRGWIRSLTRRTTTSG
ncbi:unnamed protein product [Musa acuminata subsp. malaccensis]|uniref:(wild Malaysian banana) hypothetical protein n=1 Tax=Musa acuminata subsp. malaccensis TaxID=214687 RepID=A0A804JRL9_MUSAM|nr:PREDICTED: uncharacterized protein LOC103990769 [Musa acuminata subsp. malaccensis]CAG1855482.1 unnamed protein product [Musa acuminata subsp. malaccensis]